MNDERTYTITLTHNEAMAARQALWLHMDSFIGRDDELAVIKKARNRLCVATRLEGGPKLPGLRLEDAKNFVANGRAEGVGCPCCGQLAKEYRRRMNSEIARFVIWLNRTVPGGEYIHISEWITGGGDYGKASKWGLAELMENDETAKKTSGMWRITSAGRMFARRLSLCNQYVHIYNNERVGYSGDLIDITKALGSKFDYAELMGAL